MSDNIFDLMKRYVKQAEENAFRNPSSKEIQIVIVEPQKKPYKKVIPNELDQMNLIVGGFIEILNIGRTKSGASVAITLNEEGKLLDLPFNRHLAGVDYLVGTFFITAYNMEGDNVSLSDEDADYWIKKFSTTVVYL